MLIDGYTIEQEIDCGNWKAFRDQKPIAAKSLKIGPNSVDVTLGDHLLVRKSETFIDPYVQETAEYEEVQPYREDGKDPFFMLMPNKLYLGYVRERFEARSPVLLDVLGHDDLRIGTTKIYAVPMVDGRSTLGRLGVTVHETAGFGDFGFEGCFTLEIAAREMTKLYPGMRIAQVSFQATTPNVVKKVYAGAYAGQDHVGRPVAPRLGRDRF